MSKTSKNESIFEPNNQNQLIVDLEDQASHMIEYEEPSFAPDEENEVYRKIKTPVEVIAHLTKSI